MIKNSILTIIFKNEILFVPQNLTISIFLLIIHWRILYEILSIHVTKLDEHLIVSEDQSPTF